VINGPTDDDDESGSEYGISLRSNQSSKCQSTHAEWPFFPASTDDPTPGLVDHACFDQIGTSAGFA
jgi:hypothetical protein